ncbi:hypothetical protein VPH35_086986 [Triticum aestivum]
MLLIQIFTTGLMLLTEVVVDSGSLAWTLLTYRFFLGAILAIKQHCYMRDKEAAAPDHLRGRFKELTLKVFIWIFTSALVGFTIPGFTYIGLGDTSLGYAVNFYNIIPIVAFILAVLFWKEPLDMRILVGNIKVVGTLVGVGGTLVISLYKGKVLHLWPTNINGYHPKQVGAAFGHHHVRGTILLITSSLSLAVWYTVQAQMLKMFPYKYRSTVATCFMGSIQTAVVGVAMNREKATWVLKWNMSLLTIVYSAILNITAKFVMISWVVTQRGPTYPAMFCAVTVVLGMFMILVGLYLFLWGKRKESVPPSEENPKEQMLFQGGDKNDKTQMNELRLRTIEGTGKRRFISMFTPLEGR